MSKEKLIEYFNWLEVVRAGNFTLASGIDAKSYVDVKKAYSYPNVLNLIADELCSIIETGRTCVAGANHGGITLATAISSRHNMPLSIVRTEVKNYGLGKLIEGYIPTEKDKVAIVDDVLTTGGSLRKVIDIIKPTGAEIAGCYVVVKRGEARDLEVPVRYLLTLEELLR